MKTNRYYEKYHWLIRLFFLTSIVLSGMIRASEAQLLLGSRATSMGQAVTAVPGDIWNVFANPALLPENGRAISFYGIRYYGFSELTDVALAGHFAHKTGNYGIGAHSFGDDLYRESRFRIAYSREYQGIRAGVVISYSHISIENYGSAGTPIFDAGLAYELTEGFMVGSRATNLTRSKIGQAGEELPRELALGFSYQLTDRGTFSADVVKDSRFPMSYRAGLEARIIDQLFIRGGVTTEPLTYGTGLGFIQKRWGINIVAQQHYILGWNPGFDFNINF